MLTLITGASGRLGRVIAGRFRDDGHNVLGIDSNPGASDLPTCYGADLTDEDAVDRVVQQIVSDHGMFDVLVHTVGMWDGAPTASLALADWRKVMDVNLTSTFLIFRAALRAKAQIQQTPETDSARLRLIAFASGQGADRGVADQAAYGAAKAGIIRLVESIAAEHPTRRVTTHAIAPSTILFEGMEGARGIGVHDLASTCLVLSGPAGDALSGTTIRAYGNA